MNNNVNKTFLPIGSVVILKNGVKPIMIMGFCPVPKDEEVTYDYSGCIYPEGVLDTDQVLVFNNDNIDKILFEGYKDQSEIEFKKKLNELLNSKQ